MSKFATVLLLLVGSTAIVAQTAPSLVRKVMLFGLLFMFPLGFVAQSRESADQARSSIQVGAEFSAYNPDFYCTSNSPFTCGANDPLIKGIGAFADYNVRARWGGEGEARWLHWDGTGGQVESTYLIGPRFRLYRWRSLDLWAKFLIGDGAITTAHYPAPDTLKGNLFVCAPGGSLDYRFNGKFSARLDYEQQRWPGFAVLPPNTHGISPNGFSFGVAYRPWGR